ncbi:MAG TPA: tetratricopeptide repeat protein [Bacteroidetes bacterium]|nr:tetratricopeptide repeat protein [Bacteroidota bacterium]
MRTGFAAIFLLAALLSGAAGQTSRAQVKGSPAQVQFQLAQQYERMGELERALEIYRSLYRKNPANYTYFDAVSRCLSQLKRYDELISLIQEKLKTQPGNLQFQVRLGEAYLRKGDEETAMRIWNGVLEKNRKNISVYRLIANALLQNRLYDRSIEVYLKGRKALHRPDLFALELAQLHTYRLNYRGATEEYLRFLLANPRQVSYVEARLAQFSGEPSTYRQVTEVIRRWIRKYPQNIAFRKLLISTLISFEDFEGAFAEVQALEEVKAQEKNSKEPAGWELFRFGKTCFAEGRYSLAEKAFTLLLSRYPKFPQRGNAEYELARSYARDGKYRQALRLFERVERKYPRSSWALEAYLTSGQIYLDALAEPDSAASVYQQVLYEFRRPEQQMRALLALGDVELFKGRLSQAEEYYRKVLQLPVSNVHQDYLKRLRAHLRLAEVAFYRKNFDAAKQHLASVLKTPSGNLNNELINDALELSLTIENNVQAARPALEAYADALYLAKRRMWKEAAQELRSVAEKYPDAPLAPKALFQSGQLKEKLGDYLGAVVLYQALLNQYPDHPLCDEALWRTGQIYERQLNDPSKAIDSYMAILVKYPESMYSEKARKRIRALEGKP